MEISKIDLNVCFYCMKSINEYSRTTDHLIPKSRGGILNNENKVPACKRCNQLKGDQTPKEFARAIESLLFFESTQHKEREAYLRKIKSNLQKLIK